MITTDNWKVYNRALNRYGLETQMFMVVEECGELLNAIAKYHRGRDTDKMDVITELADVSIMVEQMAVAFGMEEYEEEKQRKIERLKERLKNK